VSEIRSGPVVLEPMTWDEYDAWSAHSVRGFAAQQVASGQLPAEEATAYAERQLAELLPDGLATPLHQFWTVRGTDGSLLGHLWLRVRPQSTEIEGYVFDVELLPEVRGRGLGRATMLAAEQAARDLGATVMRLNVFGHNVAALRLYESLGYVVTATAMAKRLDGPPGPPPEPLVELRDMSQEEYAVFRPALEADYALNLAASGALPAAEARLRATEQLDALLPQGLGTPGHLLWTAYDGEQPVGLLWLHVQDRSDGPHAFGYELQVHEDLRRRGYGRSVLHAAEDALRRRGVASVGLSVFGFNDGARALYEQLGFEVTAQRMAKDL
jgi:ribosomal protein S18 acetylase RimI-like enzyme